MNKVIVIFAFTLTAFHFLFAQEEKFSLSFTNAPLIEVINEIESKQNIRFYFIQDDIDSIYVTAEVNDATLEEALKSTLGNTPIYFYQRNDEVYLSKNVWVIDDLNITKSTENTEETIEQGMVFSREFLDVGDPTGDLEKVLIEIGHRKESVPGSTSTIAGYIKEAKTGEPILGALIYKDDFSASATSDISGFYSMTLPPGPHKINIQYSGMKSAKRNILLFSDGRLDVEMLEDVITLDEVYVQSDRAENVKTAVMGVSKINVAETRNVPLVLGERDVLKLATTMAGIQTIGEGSSGFNVRGGKSDQNLIMLNEVPVYNATHFMGFFTSFNSDALKGMDVYKSNIPANYGGRLSSVFDISIKKASQTEFHGVGGISPITSKVTLEVPIIENKSGLLFSGRTTYSNWVMKNVKNATFQQNRISSQDMIIRYDHELSEKDDLQLTGYYSRDKYRLKSDSLFSFSDFSFANFHSKADWTHEFNKDLIGNFGIWFSKYGYDLEFSESEPNSFLQDFGIREMNVKTGFNKYVGNKHQLAFGAGNKFYNINPGTVSPLFEESTVVPIKIQEERATEGYLYFTDSYEINEQLLLDIGGRYSFFTALGPWVSYQYQNGLPKNPDSRTDTVNFAKGDWVQFYSGLEPRFSARFMLSKLTSIKASYNRSRQYLHTLSNSASLSPTDIWRVSTKNILPQVADQVSVGMYSSLLGNKLDVSIEAYYKWLQNLMDFKVGADFLLNPSVETAILQGPGKSYGLEFSLKKSGRLNGWINYTYSRTFIKLNGTFNVEKVNDGQFFPTNFDKPHVINAVLNWKITNRLSLSYNFNYSTGRPVTFPNGTYSFKGVSMISYSDRNAYRIPDYMRMDIGINLEEGYYKLKKIHTYWSFSIYNLTGRDNPYSVFYNVEGQDVNGYKLVVFGDPIPTITYNFNF